MLRIRMVVAGNVEMDRGLARWTEGITDWRKIWPVFGDSFYAFLKKQFETEGAEGLGQQWTELSAAYARWKQKRYPGTKILERTGKLKASLTSEKAEHAVFEPKAQSLTIGSDLPYALYHQTGTASGLPQRKEIVFTEPDKRELMRIAQMYLLQIAGSCGLRRGLTPLDVSKLHAVKSKYPDWPLPWERN